tara:strand:- start:383 stop:598 length:216 start_codon:yes stop_codon:yes gene_type:complete
MEQDTVSLYEGIILLTALIGVYLKMNNEVVKLKNRVYTLEESKTDLVDMLKQLQADIHDIKILLARKNIDQ